MWGCHFLILSSNALWRKFVKLDQGCLKLVYKSVSEGRRRRNVVHLRLLDAFNQLDWVVQLFSPLLFFRLVASAVRCRVFWHFALERMRGCEGDGGGGEREWECKEKTGTVAFSAHKTNVGSRPFSSGGCVHKSSPNCLGSTKQGCVFSVLHEMYNVLLSLSSSVNTDALGYSVCSVLLSTKKQIDAISTLWQEVNYCILFR